MCSAEPGRFAEVTSYSIRKAIEDDAAAILACLQAAFEPFRTQYTLTGYADTVLSPETIRRRMQTMVILVAECSGAVAGTIGCAAVGNGEGHLRGMAVLPDQQGSGLAEALLHAAEGELRSLGCTRVTLDTTEPLRRAIRFYERNGYRSTGRVEDFFGMALYEYAKEL